MVLPASAAERPDKLLARGHRQMAEVWAATSTPPQEGHAARASTFVRLPPITPQEVLHAWTSFSSSTTVLEAATFALLRHAAPALAALVAGLLSSCELSGQLPPSSQHIYVPWIAKAGGGVRPIQLYPCVIRTWRRIRRGIIRRWRTTAHGQLAWANTRAGIVPTDGVWRDAARSSTTGRRTATAVILADVVKCFENVE